MDLGPPELAIILVIVLVLFGGKKLPELARSLGKAKKEFEHATTEDTDKKTAPAPAPAPANPDAVDTTGTLDAPSGTDKNA